MTPQLYRKFQAALETGRWENGVTLTEQQQRVCMQAIIIYEHRHIPESERTGYIIKNKNHCSTRIDVTEIKN